MQQKLADLVAAYGLQSGEAPEADEAKQILDHMEASRTQSLSQEYIDDVLQQRGLP